jgi:hypothetical protein
MHGLPAARRRRLIVFGLLRASAATSALVAAYYLLPLGAQAGVPVAVSLAVGLLVFAAMAAYQLSAIIKARYPAIRAIEALAATAPLFLLLFAATYFVMAQANLDNFNVHSLTRTDALYFTVTVFATVGFGDIVATSEATRLAVTMQMILAASSAWGSACSSGQSNVAANNMPRSRGQRPLERIMGPLGRGRAASGW